MGRVRKPFERPEDKFSARLIIIATEGRKTERIYFEALAIKYNIRNIHVEVLPKLDDNSSPSAVFSQLEEFEKKYVISEDDELWMAIDRDYQSWEPKEIKTIAQLCFQKNNYYFGLSNPSFEIWLICHLQKLSVLPSSKRKYLFRNKRVNANKTACEHELSQLIGGFNKSNYDPNIFVPRVDDAISNTEELDIDKNSRWPYYIGSRLYILAKTLTGK